MKIMIRPATPEDVPLILALIKELAEYERAPEAAVATPELIRKHIFGLGLAPGEVGGRGPTAECVIGEVDGEPQGFAVFFHNFSTWLGKPGMYLEDLFVRPRARGVGLGKALLCHVARVAVERGCGRMEWSVLDWNEPAIGFYKKLGAVAMDEWTVYRVSGEALARLGAG
jgi:GNAT superfamily N-acetyltransferase